MFKMLKQLRVDIAEAAEQTREMHRVRETQELQGKYEYWSNRVSELEHRVANGHHVSNQTWKEYDTAKELARKYYSLLREEK